MKRLLLILTLCLVASYNTTAQESSEQTIISLDSDGDNIVTIADNRLSFMLNGKRIDIGAKETHNAVSQEPTATNTSQQRNPVYYGFAGIGCPSFNHIALFEVGSALISGLNYNMYSPEDAKALAFNSSKSVRWTINLGTLNYALNKKRSLILSSAFGFTVDYYRFANNYTMQNSDGMMYPVELGDDIKKSQLYACYFHIPVYLDMTSRRGFFFSLGVNLDILMGDQLQYKLPKTIICDEVTLNPVDFGVTARIGWKRLYAYFNYSCVNLFKEGTGPAGRRMSAGAGIWF